MCYLISHFQCLTIFWVNLMCTKRKLPNNDTADRRDKVIPKHIKMTGEKTFRYLLYRRLISSILGSSKFSTVCIILSIVIKYGLECEENPDTVTEISKNHIKIQDQLRDTVSSISANLVLNLQCLEQKSIHNTS